MFARVPITAASRSSGFSYSPRERTTKASVSVRHDASARIRMILAKRLRHNFGRKSQRRHARDIEPDFDGTRVGPPGNSTTSATPGMLLNSALQDPVFQQPEFVERKIAAHRISENFTGRRALRETGPALFPSGMSASARR